MWRKSCKLFDLKTVHRVNLNYLIMSYCHFRWRAWANGRETAFEKKPQKRKKVVVGFTNLTYSSRFFLPTNIKHVFVYCHYFSTPFSGNNWTYVHVSQHWTLNHVFSCRPQWLKYYHKPRFKKRKKESYAAQGWIQCEHYLPQLFVWPLFQPGVFRNKDAHSFWAPRLFFYNFLTQTS